MLPSNPAASAAAASSSAASSSFPSRTSPPTPGDSVTTHAKNRKRKATIAAVVSISSNSHTVALPASNRPRLSGPNLSSSETQALADPFVPNYTDFASELSCQTEPTDAPERLKKTPSTPFAPFKGAELYKQRSTLLSMVANTGLYECEEFRKVNGISRFGFYSYSDLDSIKEGRWPEGKETLTLFVTPSVVSALASQQRVRDLTSLNRNTAHNALAAGDLSNNRGIFMQNGCPCMDIALDNATSEVVPLARIFKRCFTDEAHVAHLTHYLLTAPYRDRLSISQLSVTLGDLCPYVVTPDLLVYESFDRNLCRTACFEFYIAMCQRVDKEYQEGATLLSFAERRKWASEETHRLVCNTNVMHPESVVCCLGPIEKWMHDLAVSECEAAKMLDASPSSPPALSDLNQPSSSSSPSTSTRAFPSHSELQQGCSSGRTQSLANISSIAACSHL